MLSLIGFVVIAVATYQAYKTAKGTGRNAPVWALVTLVVGVGLQLVIPLIGIVAWGIFLMASGSTETEAQAAIQGPATIVGLVGLFLSFVAVWLIFRQISKIPEEKSFIPPPTPPNFN